MKKPTKRVAALSFLISLMLVISVLIGGQSYAQMGQIYQVTITNLTRGQTLSPPIVVSHTPEIQLFTLGAEASPELVSLAEDGMAGPLADLVATLPSVFDHTEATGPVPPGESVTLEIATHGTFRLISAAGMLISTNDGFFAVQDVSVVPWCEVTVYAEAYDAGSETNSENCAFIPGPPCGNPGQRDTANAEGFIHIHAGIHGIGDLPPQEFDWRNPVAEIKIRPLRMQLQ